MTIIGIDPGQNGGIAWEKNKHTNAIKMPETPFDIYYRLKEIQKPGNTVCFLERVGTYVKGNSAPAAVKFARHCGNIEMALLALNIQTRMVAPTKWMKSLGALPKDKKERKNKIKEIMQQRYPQLNVTLSTADALGILTHGRNFLK